MPLNKTMKNTAKEFLKSIDWKKLSVENNFSDDDYYMPFVLQGFYENFEEVEEILKEIDPDLYVVGDSNGGIEISRRSFW